MHSFQPISITAQPLFDAAQMVCNIVDITQDSTLHHRAPPVRSLSEDADCVEGTPKSTRKMLKTKSVSSAALKSGPFSTIKENEKKAKKKDSTLDLSSLQQELDE
uniref:BRCA1 interacting protein C-terminal helicase 1 n=1 Tax=Ascaris lumbricoides TaxID=6252 RepID=A0A0M3INU5_ASCLU